MALFESDFVLVCGLVLSKAEAISIRSFPGCFWASTELLPYFNTKPQDRKVIDHLKIGWEVSNLNAVSTPIGPFSTRTTWPVKLIQASTGSGSLINKLIGVPTSNFRAMHTSAPLALTLFNFPVSIDSPIPSILMVQSTLYLGQCLRSSKTVPL